MAVLAGANIAMVGIMAVVPVHLEAHHHGLTSIGTVISIHVVGMFVPAPLTGWLCDRFDPAWIAAAGGGVLFARASGRVLDDYAGTVATTGGLLVLGIGWNLAVVAGSTMLTHGIDGGRERLEAMGEVAMGAAAAVGAPSASFLASSSGWPTMTLVFGAFGATAMFAVTSPQRRAAAGHRSEIALKCWPGVRSTLRKRASPDRAIRVIWFPCRLSGRDERLLDRDAVGRAPPGESVPAATGHWCCPRATHSKQALVEAAAEVGIPVAGVPASPSSDSTASPTQGGDRIVGAAVVAVDAEVAGGVRRPRPASTPGSSPAIICAATGVRNGRGE